MGWTNEQTTEIVAPEGTPFLPGNDVIGFGTQLPPEMASAGITAAIVFYNSGWNPASTSPSVKFMFIGTIENAGSGAVSIGFGVCQNPSVSQTAVVNYGFIVGTENVTSSIGETYMLLKRADNSTSWQVFNKSDHTPQENGLGPTGTPLWNLPGTVLPGPT